MAAVRVGLIDGRHVINPTQAQLEHSTLDLMLAGTSEKLAMIEGYCSFLSDQQMTEVRNCICSEHGQSIAKKSFGAGPIGRHGSCAPDMRGASGLGKQPGQAPDAKRA